MRPANRRSVRPVVVSLLIVALLPPGPAPLRAATPNRDPEALERSLEMLHLEMKLKVLQTYAQRGGFYVPPSWAQRIQDDYNKLAAELGGAAAMKSVDVEAWLEESRKARENEVLWM